MSEIVAKYPTVTQFLRANGRYYAEVTNSKGQTFFYAKGNVFNFLIFPATEPKAKEVKGSSSSLHKGVDPVVFEQLQGNCFVGIEAQTPSPNCRLKCQS